MLAKILIVLSILALVYDSTSFLQPHVHHRGWLRTNQNFNTAVLSNSQYQQDDVNRAGISATTSVEAKLPNPNMQKLELSGLKTGMQLNGKVVSSTPYAAFIDAGTFYISLSLTS